MAPLPARISVGAASCMPGVNDAEAADTVELVLLPLGVTVNVYAVPLVKPVTVQ